MTDISKEAVEKLAKTADLFAKAMKAWQHKTQKHNEDVRDTLLALSARVQELEAKNKTPKADYVRGRVQGIRDAVEVIDNAEVQEAYDEGCRIHFDDLQDFFANRVDALAEALKGDPQ